MKLLTKPKRWMNCCRIFLSLVNLVLLGIGFIVVGVTLWLWYDKKIEPDIRDNFLVEYNNNIDMDNLKSRMRFEMRWSASIIFLIGLFAVVVGLFGSAGAIGDSRRMMIFYLTITATLVVVELFIALFVYCYKTTLEQQVNDYVEMADELQMLPDMDSLRFRFGCCGVRNDFNSHCYGKMSCTDALWNLINVHLFKATEVLLVMISIEAAAIILSVVIVA